MKFRIRDGIILTSVCGQHLLVAAEAAREYCPYVTKINETAFYVLDKLQTGYSLEDLYRMIRGEFDTEDEDIESMINEYLSQLENSGYIIREEE